MTLETNRALTCRRWLYLAAACTINLFAGSIFTWSVFAAALAERLSALSGAPVAPGDLAVVFSLANGLGPIPMIFGGAVSDRFGPRFVIMGGAVMMGAGLWLSGSAASVGGLLAAYGLFFGLGLGLVYGCAINTTLKYFPDRRGLAGGLATASYGSSSVLLPPLATALIASVGVEAALHAIGAAVGVVIFAGGALLRRCPPGFRPEGWEPPPAGAFGARSCTWREMLRSPEFPPMAALLLCGATAGMMIIANGYAIAREQILLSAAEASAAVSLIALANTAGRLAAGALSDRLGRTAALSLALGLACCGLAALAAAGAGDAALFIAGLSAVGMSFGAFMGVFPGFTAEAFGSAHNGVNFGIMFAGFSAAGLLGPAIMSALRGAGLPFAACYAAAGAMSLLGFVFVKLFRRAADRQSFAMNQ